MPRFCKCGGKYVIQYGAMWNPRWFRARCDKCGKAVKQRKRQAAKKVLK